MPQALVKLHDLRLQRLGCLLADTDQAACRVGLERSGGVLYPLLLRRVQAWRSGQVLAQRLAQRKQQAGQLRRRRGQARGGGSAGEARNTFSHEYQRGALTLHCLAATFSPAALEHRLIRTAAQRVIFQAHQHLGLLQVNLRGQWLTERAFAGSQGGRLGKGFAMVQARLRPALLQLVELALEGR